MEEQKTTSLQNSHMARKYKKCEDMSRQCRSSGACGKLGFAKAIQWRDTLEFVNYDWSMIGLQYE
jgi:hypothetical protein